VDVLARSVEDLADLVDRRVVASARSPYGRAEFPRRLPEPLARVRGEILAVIIVALHAAVFQQLATGVGDRVDALSVDLLGGDEPAILQQL